MGELRKWREEDVSLYHCCYARARHGRWFLQQPFSRRFRSASIADRGQGRTPVLRAPDRKCARRTLSHRSGEGERTSAPGTSRLDGAHAYQTFKLYAVPYFYWPVLALMLGALIYTWSLSGPADGCMMLTSFCEENINPI